MVLDDRATDRQTQPDPILLGRGEGGEGSCRTRFGEPLAAIDHRHLDHSIVVDLSANHKVA